MMKNKYSNLVKILLLFAVFTVAFAQSELVLDLSRDFGYAGFSSDIEGLFSMHASGPADLERVDFYIDDALIATDTTAPFSAQFTTKDYAPGEHTLYALGTTDSGATLRSNEFVRVFLSAGEAQSAVVGVIVPIVVILAVIAVAAIGLPILFGRGKPQLGKYGLSGGAVCPKCALPFPIHFFSFHAINSHLERCPHCGKWSWVRRANRVELDAAEARWRGDSESVATADGAADRTKKQIDDSRYVN
jgi:hypothetical protein